MCSIPPLQSEGVRNERGENLLLSQVLFWAFQACNCTCIPSVCVVCSSLLLLLLQTFFFFVGGRGWASFFLFPPKRRHKWWGPCGNGLHAVCADCCVGHLSRTDNRWGIVAPVPSFFFFFRVRDFYLFFLFNLFNGENLKNLMHFYFWV